MHSRKQTLEPASDKMAAFQNIKPASKMPYTAKSVPSTPSHRSVSPQSERRSPLLTTAVREGSPRSLRSESSVTPPTSRRPLGGCRYETGMARARRRVPYALGPEKLDSNPEEAELKLGHDEQQKLTQEMVAFYERLVPTVESELRREKLVQKLERLLHDRWPGRNITVSVFGSTGNRLGTLDSDVDICITTDCKELEQVCSIAELLAKNGMERVVCVSSAKVPIVKVWDPELSVSCDMNVNNPIALENTEMIRSYVSIDDRFRPLAMIVKYWAKRRILNDAALGGTLSSYTWICLVLNFLQTRNPPILPALQQHKGLQPVVLNGVNVAFDKNLDNYQHFGQKNTSSLGELLYDFFRFYAHELDYEKTVMSVRLGKMIPKTQKAWHLLQDNRLCVEEPFNTTRNLANTADDTSMRGIHQELRRAFKLVVEGKLTECCEQYVPKDYEVPLKHSETFIHPSTKAIIPQAPPQTQPQSAVRMNRSSHRGTKNLNRTTANNGRRASNPAGRGSTYLRDLPFKMNTQELQLQAQHQQHLLHDHLFQQYQFLQRQEQELRMQLYQQSFRQNGILPLNGYHQGSISGSDNMSEDQNRSSNGRPGGSVRIPMSAPLHQQRFGSTSPFLNSSTSSQGIVTNPGSPLLGNAMLDSRRYTRRSSVNSVINGSLRAHSQPARSVPVTPALGMPRSGYDMHTAHDDPLATRRSSIVSNPTNFVSTYNSQQIPVPGTLYDAGRRPEYVGYYIGQSPSLVPYPRSAAISPMPSNAGLAIHNGGLSPHLSTRTSRISSMAASPSLQYSEPVDTTSVLAMMTENSAPGTSIRNSLQQNKTRMGPLVVNGSGHSQSRTQRISRSLNEHFDNLALSASASEDTGVETPSSSDEPYSEAFTQNGWSAALNHVNNHVSLSSPHLDKPQQEFTLDENEIVNMDMQEADQVAPHSTPPVIQPQNGLKLVDEQDDWPSSKTNDDFQPKTSETRTTQVVNAIGTALTSRPNGLEPPVAMNGLAVPEQSANGWQTQKKKRKAKKANKTESDSGALNTVGGEVLPVNETMRKGG